MNEYWISLFSSPSSSLSSAPISPCVPVARRTATRDKHTHHTHFLLMATRDKTHTSHTLSPDGNPRQTHTSHTLSTDGNPRQTHTSHTLSPHGNPRQTHTSHTHSLLMAGLATVTHSLTLPPCGQKW